MRSAIRISLICLCITMAFVSAHGEVPPYAPIGIFIGAIEEGARIFTPARMFPVADTANSEGHQFPTAQRLYGGEDKVLEYLGDQAGFKLVATLSRYPAQPDTGWPFAGYRRPPVSRVTGAPVIVLDESSVPLPGLRALCFDARQPVAFIVDTRGLTLAQRSMQRATAMGLDMTHAAFMEALATASKNVPAEGISILIYREGESE